MSEPLKLDDLWRAVPNPIGQLNFHQLSRSDFLQVALDPEIGGIERRSENPRDMMPAVHWVPVPKSGSYIIIPVEGPNGH